MKGLNLQRLKGWHRRPVKFVVVLISFVSVLVMSSASLTGTAHAWGEACSPGNFCVWENTNGGGLMKTWGGTWRNTCYSLVGSWWDGKISSYWNRMSGVDVRLNDNTNCAIWGQSFLIHPGDKGGFGFWSGWSNMNDVTSTVQFY